ncbi:MAG: Hsp20/alpha crystallin family protein [Ectothiorhodospiraceae bacterium]|nr:Hsp20/alpha crystallin family protein [Ectothiorhodospiraceae bacterium]MCH8506349.1 Hsp20/alpha crystallin family protein [Ectothiorhodospiraceae bacterium]
MKTPAKRSGRWPSIFEPDFDRFLQERFRPLFSLDDESMSPTDWAPDVDVREEDDRFVVRADLPGVDPEDIEVTLEKNVLTIRGERTEEKKEEREGYHRTERFQGKFLRRFLLPDTGDASDVSARSDKGVLEITIPKSRRPQPTRIEVKS